MFGLGRYILSEIRGDEKTLRRLTGSQRATDVNPAIPKPQRFNGENMDEVTKKVIDALGNAETRIVGRSQAAYDRHYEEKRNTFVIMTAGQLFAGLVMAVGKLAELLLSGRGDKERIERQLGDIFNWMKFISAKFSGEDF